MGFVPPPPAPSREEWERRFRSGARTVRELDPDFAAWMNGQDRFYGRAWPILIAGAVVMLAAVAMLALR